MFDEQQKLFDASGVMKRDIQTKNREARQLQIPGMEVVKTVRINKDGQLSREIVPMLPDFDAIG